MNFLSVFLLVIIVVIGYFIIMYNRFVSLRASMNASWSDVDVQLKRRYDLIPALVDTVKGYKKYEAEVLGNIVKARQRGLSANSVDEKAAAANVTSDVLSKMFALAEAYPDLKANTNFLKLQSELANLEDAIQNARRYYNAVVRDYNYRLEAFPDVLVAQIFQYTSRDYFELDEGEVDVAKEMPKINL